MCPRRRRTCSSSGRGRLALLLQVEHGLELRRRLEARVVGMLLVEVVFLLRAQLGRDVVEDALEQAVDGFLLGRVAVPDGDEMGVKSNREADTADLVACLVSGKLPV